MSFWSTFVVQPVSVVECTAVPLEIVGFTDPVILLAAVGIAVPLAIFQMSTVAVPVSTVTFQELMTQE
jgi:hypothetical protein